ncbi:alternative oxidase-domain-containing protein [Phlyctochytrium arcticum]|nr:alternative oxidase-domain-containing protein [Phlyctochytrium arcticum]
MQLYLVPRAATAGLHSSRLVRSHEANPAAASGLAPTPPNRIPDPGPHSHYDNNLADFRETHLPPSSLRDKLAHKLVYLFRQGYDTFTGYSPLPNTMTEPAWLNRVIFLETIAGVPGMVGGMALHLRSLRLVKDDPNCPIATLLDEAQNERMHLLVMMNLKEPSFFFRMMVLGAQGVFFNLFFASYLLSPKTCHRFVGYLEEQACHTYTRMLQDIESGKLQHWKTTAAPDIAIDYWGMKKGATLKEVIEIIRLDESRHRDVNHSLSEHS